MTRFVPVPESLLVSSIAAGLSEARASSAVQSITVELNRLSRAFGLRAERRSEGNPLEIRPPSTRAPSSSLMQASRRSISRRSRSYRSTKDLNRSCAFPIHPLRARTLERRSIPFQVILFPMGPKDDAVTTSVRRCSVDRLANRDHRRRCLPGWCRRACGGNLSRLLIDHEYGYVVGL